MADSKIQVGESGDWLQTYKNDLGDGPVHSEAVTPTNPDGTSAIGVEIPDSFHANTVGPVDAFSPSSGKRIGIKHMHLAARPSNNAVVLVTVRWKTSGDLIWRGEFSEHGGAYGTTINGVVRGAVDEPIEIELSAAQSVDFNIRYEEVS